jgi:hypothetical protein
MLLMKALAQLAGRRTGTRRREAAGRLMNDDAVVSSLSSVVVPSSLSHLLASDRCLRSTPAILLSSRYRFAGAYVPCTYVILHTIPGTTYRGILIIMTIYLVSLEPVVN